MSPPLSEMDVVYPIRTGDDNEELRYSLRSLDNNFPHAKVWFVGYRPPWVQNIYHLPGNVYAKYDANGYGNLRIAAHHKDVSDCFVIFNDDFYVTAPVTELKPLYHCTLDYHINMPAVQKTKGWFYHQLVATKKKLTDRGLTNLLSYELHIPMVVEKEKFREILDEYAYELPELIPQCRSLYGNILQVGGEKVYDVKFHTNAQLRKPYHSTEDASFAYFKQRLCDMFPNPSRYEKA